MNALETRRQAVHITAGIILLVLYGAGIIDWQAFGIIFLATGAFCIAAHKGWAPARRVLAPYDRPGAYMAGWGAVTYVEGLLIAALLFPQPVAAAAMIIMILGDGASTIIGANIGRHRLVLNPKKTIEGTAAGLFAGFAGALLFVPFPVALLGAAVGSAIEALPKPHPLFDDNFLIPLGAGAAMLINLSVLL